MTTPSLNSIALMKALWQPPTTTSNPETEQAAANLDEWLGEDVLWQHTQPEKSARWKDLPKSLPSALRTALMNLGIHQLYSHQYQSYQAIRAGQDVIATTETASGKTLAALLAPMEAAMRTGERTLVLYNLKALSNDQSHTIHTLLASIPAKQRPRFVQLTGDTPSEERQARLEQRPHLIGTTPEFIHFQLRNVPWSETLGAFFRSLKFVVIDEAHTCSGTFGANMKLLMGRIKCAVDRAGGNAKALQFIFLSATCSNAKELARKLSNRRKKRCDRLTWIRRSGAASAEKQYYLLKNHGNANANIAQIVVYLLAQNQTGIVFCNSIKSVNAIYELIEKEAQRQHQPLHLDQVATYFAALSCDRRETIIQQVRAGKTQWVIATEALEAGVDLPELDCCIHRGSPATIQSFQQRSGRVGRKRKGWILYLPLSTTLDQSFVLNPDQIIAGKAEIVTFQASPILIAQHLLCAANESGIASAKLAGYFGKDAVAIAQTLLNQGLLNRSRQQILWSKAKPYREISFRGIATNNAIQLIDTQSGESFQTVNLNTAHREVFKNAIYRCQNPEQGGITTYRSINLDLESNCAQLERISDTPQYTTATTQDNINLGEIIAPDKPIELAFSIAQSNQIQLAAIPSVSQLTIGLTWAEIQHQVTGYTLLTKQYDRTCLNRSCLKQNQPIAIALCPLCGRKTRQAEITKVLEEVVFQQPYQSTWATPALSIQLNGEAQIALKAIAKLLKASVKQCSIIPTAYKALWEYHSLFVTLHSFGNQILKAMPISVSVSQNDINFQIIWDQQRIPVGIFYNQIPESGAVESLYTHFSRVVRHALRLSRTCECEVGCVQCLMRNGDPHGNTALLKPLGTSLLEAISI